ITIEVSRLHDFSVNVIINGQRRALRFWFAGGKHTQGRAINLWQTEYYSRVTQVTISDMLSSKYAFLDEPEPGSLKENWIDLQNALFEWEQRFEAIQGIVTGDILRHKPTEIWQWLP
ncbi:putative centromere binding protein cbh2, partial [Golovinomyces cichoracearum]